jgi:hypothetical protein
VGGDGFFGPIDLPETEAARVIGVLEKVEARDARLLRAVAGVLDGGDPECVEVFGLDVNVNVKD